MSIGKVRGSNPLGSTMAFVYIFQDKNNRFYIGSTDNLERRLIGYGKIRF